MCRRLDAKLVDHDDRCLVLVKCPVLLGLTTAFSADRYRQTDVDIEASGEKPCLKTLDHGNARACPVGTWFLASMAERAPQLKVCERAAAK